MYVHLRSVSVRLVVLTVVSLSASAALGAPRDRLPDRLAELRAATALPGRNAAATKLTPALRAAYVQARQKEAGHEYGVTTRSQVGRSHDFIHEGLCFVYRRSDA